MILALIGAVVIWRLFRQLRDLAEWDTFQGGDDWEIAKEWTFEWVAE